MNNYLIIAIGWLVGQIGYASVSVYIIQKDLPSINYWQAVNVYLKKEIGSFVMAFSALLIILFVAADFIDPTVSKADLKSKATLSLIERIVLYMRVSAVILGGLSQHLLYVAFKKGKKAIHDYAAKNTLDSNT
jgi:hypothetical protein